MTKLKEKNRVDKRLMIHSTVSSGRVNHEEISREKVKSLVSLVKLSVKYNVELFQNNILFN